MSTLSFEALFPLLISGLSVVAAGLTAWVTHRLFVATVELKLVTQRMAEISHESTRSTTDALVVNAVNAQNAVVLANMENMRSADTLIKHEGLDTSDEAIRERWIAFTLLNVQQLLYFEAKSGRFSSTYQEVNATQVLDRILGSENVQKLLQERGYSPEFVEYCQGRIHNMSAKSAA